METTAMANLPKIALGAWAWGNDGTFGNSLTAESLKPIFDTAMANGLNLLGSIARMRWRSAIGLAKCSKKETEAMST